MGKGANGTDPKRAGGVPSRSGSPHQCLDLGFSVAWQNSTLLEGDIVDAVRKLKASDGGNINVVCSGDLAQTLTRHGLGDEYR
ncbi:hypothetical protein GCM10010313_01390 [Streptomyces violarus]|uniref:Bacterial bifunctional deaminase-reductase C-terminal domain-containing protein n=1 Tax=Streptomyces violarus TaxID=67380 RepID=A0A7W4ZJJ8_9ACTN|nr:hypothetical protein [Streptomyces violarus]GHC95855.1 hypothetical protein GCM10010313_01390 [Streptomyces violarus]